MKLKSFILCLFAAYSAFAFDFSKTEFLQIPEGNVYQIKNSNGEILWSVVPYVNEGLVDWWDAKWNAGIGQHDNEAASWKDLVGTRDAALFTNYYWTDDSWVVQSVSDNGLAAINGGDFPKSQTWQVVLKPSDWKGYNAGSRIMVGPVNLRFMATNSVSWYASYGVSPNYVVPNYDIFQLHQHTITHEEDSPTVKYWIDGKCVYTNNSATANSDTSQYLYFANRFQRDIGIDAEYHTVRLYDRVLTDDEIFRNTRVDVKRYGIPQYWCEFSFRDGGTVITNLTSLGQIYRENLDLVDTKIGTDCPSISGYAFLDCKNLTNITFPNNLSSIGYWAFRWCTNLTSIAIPDSCGSIRYSAFYGCSGLTNIYLPNALSSIQHSAFHGCSGIQKITLPSVLQTINYDTFRSCLSLSEVANSTNVTFIGTNAFMNCSALQEFTFGPNIETLETNVFLNSGIQTINYYKKDTETNEEAETRIKNLVEGTGLDISDKEFVCLNYDYSSGAWSHIDLTDVDTLFNDNALTVHPAIGEPVQRIVDKANPNTVWNSSSYMVRTTNGIKSTRFDDEGEALNTVVYQTNAMFDADTDYNNVEFATALVINNDEGRTDYTTHVTRFIQPAAHKIFSMLYSSSATDRGLSIRALNNTQINISPIHRKNFQDGAQLFVVSVKSVDGQVEVKVYVNGVLVGIYQTTVGEDIAGTSFMPAICTTSVSFVPADYCENLWWDHIPENIDEIQKALMRKYNIPKQTIYFKDAFSWVELTDEGILFTNTTASASAQAQIGDPVLRARDKITAYLWSVSGMVRTEDGLRPTNIVSNDYADTWQLYQNTSGPKIKPADTDWSNTELAFAIMTCNDTCTGRGYGVVRLLECAGSSYITRMFYNEAGKLYSRLLKSGGNIVVPGTDLRSLLQNKPTLYVCQLKVMNGVATEVVSINGKKFTISGTIDPDYVSGRYFLPGIKSNAAYGGMPVDYQEVLFWDHIPEDIDNIEKALMDKYNVKPLVIE